MFPRKLTLAASRSVGEGVAGAVGVGVTDALLFLLVSGTTAHAHDTHTHTHTHTHTRLRPKTTTLLAATLHHTCILKKNIYLCTVSVEALTAFLVGINGFSVKNAHDTCMLPTIQGSFGT